MDVAAAKFFKSKFFGVVGASSNPSKFGYKVLAWYHHHPELDVIAINPSTPKIHIDNRDYDAIASLESLPHPAQTSISVITPPAVTLKTLEQATILGVPSVWMQPGSFDQATMDFAVQNFQVAIAGLQDSPIGEDGWCILVDGDAALNESRSTV